MVNLTVKLSITTECWQWLEDQRILDGYKDIAKEIEDILEIVVLKEDE